MAKIDRKTTSLDTVLRLPAELCSGWRMRPELGMEDQAKSLTGTDMAMLLILIDQFIRLDDGSTTIRIPQLELSKRFGRVKGDRLRQSLDRISANQLWIGEQYAAPIVRYSTIQPSREHPDVPVAPDWIITLDTDLAEAVRRGMDDQTIAVRSSELRLLSSRHSVALWLRFLAWGRKTGLLPPEHWPVRLQEIGSNVKLHVPIDEVDELFGFEGRMPLSRLLSLFSTVDKAWPAVQRELAQVGVDVDIRPERSTRTGKIGRLQVHLGMFHVPFAAMGDMKRWEDRRPLVAPKRRKSGIANNSAAKRKRPLTASVLVRTPSTGER